MSALLDQLALCIERGKVDAKSPHPKDMKDQDGADELTQRALAEGVPASEILAQGMVIGMGRIGQKYSENKAFVPDLLMAAKAMKAAMVHLRPHFDAGEAHYRGSIVIGTVKGDMHDIGKHIVSMIMEGGGWKVIDLGVDVAPEKFAATVKENPGSIVGLSALLTTTMLNMQDAVKAVKAVEPSTKVIIGGAPVTQEFANKIGADAYAPDPQVALNYLNALCV